MADAQAADAAHARQVATAPPDPAAPPDPYRSDSGAAGTALSEAQRAWQECVDAANGVRSELVSAVDSCVRVVDEATDMRFKENPKWYDLGGQFTNFVRDNQELLQQLSGALKVVSLVAGVLSFIPVLAPVMAPLAVGTALAASAIDLSIYAATGQGSLRTILIDVGLTVLPGVGKLARMGMARYSDDAARIAPGSPPRPGGCFVAGTTVLTVGGRRPIESLLVGDEVVTGDPHSGKRAIHPVRARFSHTVPVVLTFTVQETCISCSPEHPFWTSASGWKKAVDLSAGDVLVDVDGAQRPISAITRHEGTFVVHNIEVDGLHTYHVSELHLLVHNKPMRIPRPEGTPKKVDDKYLKRHGVDPHTAKGDLPGPPSRFDIYVDRNGNMFGVPKGGKPEDGEFLGNIADG